MIQSFQRLGCVMVGAIASTMLADAASAQLRFNDYPTNFQPFAEEFTRAATRTSGDAFKAQSFASPLSTWFGISFPWPGSINGFPETLITNDAKLLHQVYNEGMLRQTSRDPVIRTADLPNPYNTSILTQPAYGDLNLQTVPDLPIGNR